MEFLRRTSDLDVGWRAHVNAVCQRIVRAKQALCERALALLSIRLRPADQTEVRIVAPDRVPQHARKVETGDWSGGSFEELLC